ncbi:TetR/AcrR family transcriptional regulator [Pseudonocardia xinjiangensis]|uniref:TetR/AcrR family transcriptional regulator n=1 Tax=Pseudonocardia xinjiangensis TaxID=75289 RepID=A0ABX1RJP0_9PSEU|nr:TetR/AcrR family transcriptional regulator [Pseudonocardia xinjiangensis]NMH80593.1 TetR/AcrR family transcriptional regulator [Pseudonocardia xinjiangensis]
MGHREDLLAGAKRCLADKGFAATTARDIVAASGTNLASIGYHFGSKDALLNAAIIDSFDDWDDEIAHALRCATPSTPVDRLEAFLDGVVAALARDRSTAVASVQAYARAEHTPELRDQIADAYDRGRRSVAALILDVAEDEVDERTALQLGSLALALVNGLVLQTLLDPERAPSGRDLAAALRALRPDEPAQARTGSGGVAQGEAGSGPRGRVEDPAAR